MLFAALQENLSAQLTRAHNTISPSFTQATQRRIPNASHCSAPPTTCYVYRSAGKPDTQEMLCLCKHCTVHAEAKGHEVHVPHGWQEAMCTSLLHEVQEP